MLGRIPYDCKITNTNIIYEISYTVVNFAKLEAPPMICKLALLYHR